MPTRPHQTQIGRPALEHLFGSSADCIKLLDRDGRILLLNAGGAITMELDDPAQLVGLDWIGFWRAGPERERAAAALASALAGGTGRCGGFLPTAKGTPRWWDTAITPVCAADGSVDSLLAVSRDITERHHLAEELKAEVRRTEALITATAEIVWRADAAQQLGSNNGLTSLAGGKVTDSSRQTWLARVHPEERAGVDQRSRDGMAAGVGYVSEYRLRNRDGAFRWVEDRVVPIRDDDGLVAEWVGVITDVHDRVTADLALRHSEERLRLALQAGRIGTWDVDLRTGVRRWSDEFKALLGYPPDMVEDEQSFFDLVHPDDLPMMRNAHRTAFQSIVDLAYRIRRADTGEERWILSSGRACLDGSGHPVRRIGVAQDITARKQVEHQLWLAANRDPLTGLPNRALFNANLDKAIERAGREATRVALMVVDLDRFKEVNDTLGHDAGDAVLRMVAGRLARVDVPGATIARLGGDEFAVLLPGAASVDAVTALAETLIADLGEPLPHEGDQVMCPASIGLALFPDHDRDGCELLKNADLALYAAKRGGRARLALFEPGLKTAMQRRVTVLHDARQALARGAIMPFYQPKVGLDGAPTGGFEALLRWRDDTGIQGPAALAQAFEDPDLSAAIGARMLDLVIADITAWQAAGLAVGSIAVNVAAAEFSRVDVAERWLGALHRAGLPPGALQMEVTESVFLGEGSDTVNHSIGRLHRAGVAIALDDFGTGFASLTHLRQQPVDWLKLDRSFIGDIDTDSGARAIVSAVIDLAHGIGLKVVAEGVETEAQRALLALNRCDLAQGYLFARPMPTADVARFLGKRRRAFPSRPPARAAP